MEAVTSWVLSPYGYGFFTVLALGLGYWWQNRDDEEKDEEEVPKPQEIVLPPLPTEPFDQLFKDYSQKFGSPLVQTHQQKFPDSRFIQRILPNCIPPPSGKKSPEFPQYEPFRQISDGIRTYYLHVPSKVQVQYDGLSADMTLFHGAASRPSSGKQDLKSVPLVVFIHGTDETAFDGELIHQPNSKQSTWLELAEKEGIVLLFAQARGLWSEKTSSWRPPGDYLKSLWLPKCVDSDQFDSFYFESAIDDAFKVCHSIDKQKIHLIGFSNGGFMACDLLLSSFKNLPSKSDSFDLPTFKHPLASVCLYMGGINGRQMGVTLGIDKYKLPNIKELTPPAKPEVMLYNPDIWKPELTGTVPRVLIITGTFDCQIFSCLNALQSCYQFGLPAQLITLPEKSHEYQPESTEFIWTFFSNRSCM